MPQKTQATSGTPTSNEFGYGVRVDLQGTAPHSAILDAGKYHLDWIAIDFNWQDLQPNAEEPPAWQEIDAAISLAAQNQLGVMVSITQPPIWAITLDGPEPDKTSDLVASLVRRYSSSSLAIEVFPSANTIKGWGSTPNPKAYTRLLKHISHTIEQLSTTVVVVGTGLTPLTSPSDGMDDLTFLRQIYAEGIAEYMPVVGLRLPPLASDPLARIHQTGEYSLRHYENIRSIMTENGHKNGLIWITGFSWDANALDNRNEQAAWMKQAYLLFRSQLYIGAAFFDSLNSQQPETTLLLSDGEEYHPGFEELIQIIAQDHNEQTIIISIGSPKRLSNKTYFKVDKS